MEKRQIEIEESCKKIVSTRLESIVCYMSFILVQLTAVELVWPLFLFVVLLILRRVYGPVPQPDSKPILTRIKIVLTLRAVQKLLVTSMYGILDLYKFVHSLHSVSSLSVLNVNISIGHACLY